MLRIKKVDPLSGYRLRLTLTDGSVVESDVGPLLHGPVFESIRRDPELFRKVSVERGTVCWPGDVDLCPDTVLWNGPPKQDLPAQIPAAADDSDS
jgi:Protein of unknown function (DUF2442)